MPVGVQRQIPMIRAVQKSTEISQLQCINDAIDDPVMQVPRVQVVEKTVGIPQLQVVEETVEAPQTQTIQSTQTSQSLGGAPVRQVAQAETVQVDMVKPCDPDAQIKFLVKEVPHGVGGFVPDANGNRVANEMGGWNCVTGEMWKNQFPSRPALDNAISDDVAWQCKH